LCWMVTAGCTRSSKGELWGSDYSTRSKIRQTSKTWGVYRFRWKLRSRCAAWKLWASWVAMTKALCWNDRHWRHEFGDGVCCASAPTPAHLSQAAFISLVLWSNWWANIRMVHRDLGVRAPAPGGQGRHMMRALMDHPADGCGLPAWRPLGQEFQRAAAGRARHPR
jgi:hypothetical protein